VLAMQTIAPHGPLVAHHIAIPRPMPHQIVIQVNACGVCRTDLHILDGEVAASSYPRTLGHEIVGKVVERGAAVTRFSPGDRVGIPWLGRTCGSCDYCVSGRENLCGSAQFTGCDFDGGYAEYVLADARYCFAIPPQYSDSEAAPLLCAGLIGYRSLRAAGNPRRLGLYGFGAAAHIVAQIARFEGRDVFAFTRPGDQVAQSFARAKGAIWAGDSDHPCSQPLDAAIIFAPVGALVPLALKSIVRGGTVVCAGIHMSDIPSFPYSVLWGERAIKSVANLTRRDGEEFMALASRFPIRTDVECFALADANDALYALRAGRVSGAAVLQPKR
jgi:alcohol dehydrogenase, propanol-preferring